LEKNGKAIRIGAQSTKPSQGKMDRLTKRHPVTADPSAATSYWQICQIAEILKKGSANLILENQKTMFGPGRMTKRMAMGMAAKPINNIDVIILISHSVIDGIPNTAKTCLDVASSGRFCLDA
jgi:hypothetical protein